MKSLEGNSNLAKAVNEECMKDCCKKDNKDCKNLKNIGGSNLKCEFNCKEKQKNI